MDFDTRFRAVRAEALRFAVKLCRNRDTAEDLVQGAAVKGFQAYADHERISSFRHWIFRIITNLYVDLLRSPKSGEVSLCTLPHEGEFLSLGEDKNSLEIELLLRLLNRLPKHEREAILAVADGTRLDEAAERFGLSYTAFKSRLYRGRRQAVQLLRDLDLAS